MPRITKVDTPNPRKVVLVLGYAKYILPLDAAVALFEAATSMEIMEDKYDSANSKSYFLIRPADPGFMKIENLSDETYAVGRMVYKAEELAKQQGETK